MAPRLFPVVLLTLVLVGCSSSPTPETPPPPAAERVPAPQPGTAAPASPAVPSPTSSEPAFDRMDASTPVEDRAALVARQAEEYARSVEQALAARGLRPPGSAARSQVEWVEPDQFSLSPALDVSGGPAPGMLPAAEPRPLSPRSADPRTDDSRTHDSRAAEPRTDDLRAGGTRAADPRPSPSVPTETRPIAARDSTPPLERGNPVESAAVVASASPDPLDDPSVAGANEGMSIASESGRTRPGANPSTAAEPLPAATPPAASSGSLVPTDAIEQKLLQQIRDYPRDVSAHLDYQLHLLVRDEPVPNLSAMSSLPAEDRELIVTFVDGLTNFRNAVRADANLLLSRKVRPLVDMADRLRSRADLSVPVLALCRKVEGFGRYDAFDPPRFVAGKPQQAIIYCEVDNFASQLNDGKLWETRLTMEGVLYTEGGLPVWNVKTDTLTDLARNRRRDFFLVKVVTLNEQLTIGRYLLKVTIVDQQSNRVAEASIPIQIVSSQP